MPRKTGERGRMERIKQVDQSHIRKPGTGRRAASSKRAIQRSNEPLTDAGEKPPIRNPPKVNKAPVPRTQPNRKQAAAAKRRQARHAQATAPKAKNIR